MNHPLSLLLIVIVFTCISCHASDPPPLYTAHRSPTSITIDGKLDDPAWNSAPWTRDFVDVRGSDYPAPSLRTRCKVLWDDQNLYIAAELQDPHVWGTMTQQGSHLYEENNFEVFLDPQRSGRNYWELEINALNTTWDLQMSRPYSEGGGPIPGTALAGLRTAVNVRGTLNNPADQDQGWTAEIAIPWTSTNNGHPPKDGDQWRMLLCRIEWDLHTSTGQYKKVPTGEHYWAWSPAGAINYHMPEKYGQLRFAP
jgi:hypothetical protein